MDAAPGSRRYACDRIDATVGYVRANWHAAIQGREWWIRLALSVSIAALALHGIGLFPPTLRHDWAWPRHRESFLPILADGLGGWNSSGIGSPSAFANTYGIAEIVTIFGTILGHIWGFDAVIIALFMLITWGAIVLTEATGARLGGAVVVALLLAFNPWVYTEVVAGHIYMIASYAAIINLAGLVARRHCTHPAIPVLLVIAVGQLQLFIAALVVLAPVFIAKRAWRALVSVLLVITPTLVSFVASYGTLSSTLYLWTWQRTQSIDIPSAIRLTGYFTGYADSINKIIAPALITLILFAVASVVLNRSRSSICIGVGVATLIIAVSGAKGPIAPLYAWLVAEVPASGVFRELYDLVGLVALGYSVLIARLFSKYSKLELVALLPALLLSYGWMASPPSTFFVSEVSLPDPRPRPQHNVRFALLPAIQPLSFHGVVGSGADPDAFVEPGGSPVNEYIPRWPSIYALTLFEDTGDVSGLSALGVSEVIARNYLSADRGALENQVAITLSRDSGIHTRAMAISSSVSLYSILNHIKVDQVPVIGAGNISFTDAANAHGDDAPFAVPRADGFHVRASEGWVDARLAFAAASWISQPYGGVMTSSSVPLQLMSGRFILAAARGRVYDNRSRLIVNNVRRFSWYELKDDATSLVCDGLCVVAVQSELRPYGAAEDAVRLGKVVSGHEFVSWLHVINLPAGTTGTLRLNIGYDPKWFLLSPWRTAHLRLDSAVNGWLLPQRDSQSYAIAFNTESILICIAALCATMYCYGSLFESLLKLKSKRMTKA